MRWLLIGLGIAAASLALLLWPGTGGDQQPEPLEPDSETLPLVSESSAEPLEEIVRGRSEPDRSLAEEEAAASQSADAAPEASKADRETLLIRAQCVTEGGQPLADVVLEALTRFKVHRATSSASGSVELRLNWPVSAHSDTLSVEAGLMGWTTLRRRVPLQEPGEVDLGDLTFAPGGDVVGRVVDEGGRGLSGALVQMVELLGPAGKSLEGHGPSQFFSTLENVHLASSFGEDGRFRLKGAPAREISLAVRLKGYDSARTDAFLPVAGQETKVPEIILRKPTTGLRGVVLDERGPLARASVRLHSAGSRFGSWLGSIKSDREGAFLLSEAAPGQVYRVEIYHPRREEMRLRFEEVVMGGPKIEAVFPERRWVRVSMQSPDGTPLDGSLSVKESRDSREAVTQSSGTGTLRMAVPNYPFELVAQAPGFEATSAGNFEPWSLPDHITVTLSRSGMISGRVFVNGVPRSGVELHVHERLPGKDWSARSSPGSRVRTSKGGSFALTVEGGREYLLHAHDSRHGQAELEILDLPVGGSREDIHLELLAGGTLQGRLILAPGVSATRNLVVVDRGGGHVQHKVLDESGYYRFENLMPGLWQIDRSWTASGFRSDRMRRHHPKPPYEVVVKSGEVTKFDLDYSKEAACRVSGRSYLAAAHPGPWQLSGVGEGRAAEGTIDSEGNYELTVSGEGTISLNLNMTDGAGSQWHYFQSLELVAGDNRVDLAWPGEPSEAGQVHVTGLDTQVPSDSLGNGYSLEVRTGASNLRVSFQPGSDGSWKSGPIPAGTVKLHRGARHSRSGYLLETMAVAPGEIARYEHR